jgi:hypothetical protein
VPLTIIGKESDTTEADVRTVSEKIRILNLQNPDGKFWAIRKNPHVIYVGLEEYMTVN